ncbi:MAG TPA: PQQ-binding-like beta-propeller repeat protein [Gemmataceae bacterium]|nr:PQQ-binding-like beta-propeller repeat protein [Gemmataceae bacterium]
MRAFTAISLLVCPLAAVADDWPCWRGPNHNGISAENGWVDSWPREGPKTLWRANVGTGFCTVAVAGGRLFTIGNKDDIDTVHCLDAESGKPIWQHSYPAPTDPNLFEGGPTATPTVDGDHVYTLSRQGDLFCFAAATGNVVWSQNVIKEAKQRVPSWGLAGSPLVHQSLLLLNLGDAGVALEKRTGKVVWNSEVKDPGYSSPVPFRRGGQWFAVISCEDAYVAVNIETGKELWRIDWPTNYGVNAADPIVSGDEVFLSSGYNKGCGLFKTSDGQPTAVWQNKNLRNQINSSVLVDGFLYGIDGDTASRTRLRCVDLKTGATRWEEESVGCGSLTAAAGRLIILSDRGELVIAKASPDKFQAIARAKVLEGKCWTVPVLANGRIYCRNADGEVVCLDVRK